MLALSKTSNYLINSGTLRCSYIIARHAIRHFSLQYFKIDDDKLINAKYVLSIEKNTDTSIFSKKESKKWKIEISRFAVSYENIITTNTLELVDINEMFNKKQK
jgi:hypothetical protein